MCKKKTLISPQFAEIIHHLDKLWSCRLTLLFIFGHLTITWVLPLADKLQSIKILFLALAVMNSWATAH